MHIGPFGPCGIFLTGSTRSALLSNYSSLSTTAREKRGTSALVVLISRRPLTRSYKRRIYRLIEVL